jgi:hypothetical protein
MTSDAELVGRSLDGDGEAFVEYEGEPVIMDEMDLVRQLKEVPPLRPEAYERARATLGTKNGGPVRRERFAWLRNLSLPSKVGIGVVGAAVTFAASPAPTTAVPTAQGPEVGGRLVARTVRLRSCATSTPTRARCT